MNNPFSRRAAFPVLLASVLAMTACSGGPTASVTDTKPVAGGSVSWGVHTEPTCFDPHRTSQQNAYLIIRNYVDSLVAKDTDGTFKPWLAKEWKISEDAKTYTFKLRDDVKFSDGTPFNASVAKANLDYIMNPSNAVDAAGMLLSYASSAAPDNTTLVINLKNPDSSVLESLSSVRTGFLSPSSLEKGDALCAGGPDLVGTGPFTFGTYTRGQSVDFVKNPDYNWGPGYAKHTGAAYLDKVTYRFMPEYATRAGALSSGQVDIIEGVQPTDIPLFKDVDGFQFLVGPSAQTAFTLNVNYTHAPADDIRVRQALRDGFDGEAVLKSVYLGTVPKAWGNIGPSNPDFAPSLKGTWGNDVAGANKKLDEAGWTERDSAGFRTKDGKRLTIEVGYPQPYVRDNRDVLIQAVQAELKQNIGLDLALKINTAGELTETLNAGNWSIYPNTVAPMDAALELQAVLGRPGYLYKNVAGYDKDLDAKILQALGTSDLQQRRPLLAEIQHTAVEKGYIVPLFSPNYQIAAKSAVGGLGFEAQLDSPSNSYEVWVNK